MQTTVVSTMVSHTVGWARVFWALPEKRGLQESQSRHKGSPLGLPISFFGSPTFPVSKLKESSLASFCSPNVYLQIEFQLQTLPR